MSQFYDVRMDHDQIQFDLFKSPFYERLVRLGLTKSVGLAILMTWVPLVALSSCYKSADFLMDVSVYLKFLVALPLMLVAPFTVKKKLRNIIAHFIKSGIVKETDREKFLSYINSTAALKKSRPIKLFLLLIIYALLISAQIRSSILLGNTWRFDNEGFLSLSYAGFWFAFISHPIYNFLQIYFIFNGILWLRLMYLISRLDLNLKASHGDDTGGLIFLGSSIRIFYLPIFAFSSTFATGAVQLVLHRQFGINDIKFSLITLVIFCLLLFVSPLMFFYFPLLRLKSRSVFRYGILGMNQLEMYEERWLNSDKKNTEASLMDAPDFSAVIDNLSIINKVSLMRLFPFTPRAVGGFIICILLPFFPVVALEISWSKLFQQLLSLVM